MVHDGPKLIAPMLFLGQSYGEKLFSTSLGEISRNPIPHQIEPTYAVSLEYIRILKIRMVISIIDFDSIIDLCGLFYEHFQKNSSKQIIRYFTNSRIYLGPLPKCRNS